ncbi:MAG: HAD family phosphatase [Lachnospiraceae bacterium]|nr:HAD family phosphatase [Lachnospiraceae bacterium]
MKFRLLCVDLDGTLLTDDKEVSDEDISALRKAVSQGIQIALITGRMPAAVEGIARQLAVPCIRACNAGTYILDGEHCIHTEYLSVETMEAFYDRIRTFEIPFWIYREKQWFVTAKDRFVKEEEKRIDHRAELVTVEDLALQWRPKNTGPNKLLVGAQPQLVQKVHAQLKNHKDADMACSSPYFLEIFPSGMNKGRALQLICDKMGIRREETIAFGDQELDIPMLEAAGTAVAMGNAIEELKGKADFITRTNNESGIAYALKYYLYM